MAAREPAAAGQSGAAARDAWARRQQAPSARVAPHWSDKVPGYGLFLSCRAFDLEEMLDFGEAERLGRAAVEIDPTDVWGAHAVAHVLIMQGRHEDGVAWLDGLKCPSGDFVSRTNRLGGLPP